MLSLLAFFLVLVPGSVWAKELPSIQSLIDQAQPGDIIKPAFGTYYERVVVNKPITIDGRERVVIDAGGDGSPIYIKTNGATVQNMILRNSGDQHNDLDSGIQVRGNYNAIKDNFMEDVLFGIDLGQSSHNILRRNRIKSKDFGLGVRGDGIRLWYSHHNKIYENRICDARDMVVWYSEDNHFRGNEVCYGRYGMHFMYSKYNLVEDNYFHHNSVGIFLMYSDGVVVKNNRVSHSVGATGMGIGFKEASDMTVEGNMVYYAARGMYLDVSPLQPDTFNRIYNNTVAYCAEGIVFHNDWVGNKIRNNRWENNYIQVSVNTRATVNRNEWDGNYWDNYLGFDRDRDGVGDTPYRDWVFADRLWLDVPYAAFYKGSPLLSLMDFIERLAPFSEPLLLVEDKEPLMRSGEAVITDELHQEKVDDAGGIERIDPFGLRS